MSREVKAEEPVRRWQFVNWGLSGRWGLRLRGTRHTYPAEGPNRGLIYSAMYRIGPFELRRWAKGANER